MNLKIRTKEMTAKTDTAKTTISLVNITRPESAITITSAMRLFKK